MSGQFAGKAALVTGASRCIGAAIASGLAAQGAAVAVGYVRNADRAQQVVRSITDAGGKAVAVPADLADSTQIPRLFDAAGGVF